MTWTCPHISDACLMQLRCEQRKEVRVDDFNMLMSLINRDRGRRPLVMIVVDSWCWYRGRRE
jgi:hypothetical protein